MSPYLDAGDVRLYLGDARAVLAELPDASVDCVVTSPPYYGLRDYGQPGQLGQEPTPAAFVAALVEVFTEVWRVLAPWGTCWVNIGDSYAGSQGARGRQEGTAAPRPDLIARYGTAAPHRDARAIGAKPKDLLMVPARLALALQDAGWWLRSDVIWHKPNPMPSSATDRPTCAHEHVYLLTRAPVYWYDAVAIQEPAAKGAAGSRFDTGKTAVHQLGRAGGGRRVELPTRNARDVWTITPGGGADGHYATMPEELARRCIVAGCPPEVCRTCGEPRRRLVERVGEDPQPLHTRTADGSTPPGNVPRKRGAVGPSRAHARGWSDCGHDDYRPGVVLDPFAGAGTTAIVARAQARDAVGIELSPEYAAIARRRLGQRAQVAMGLLT